MPSLQVQYAILNIVFIFQIYQPEQQQRSVIFVKFTVKPLLNAWNNKSKIQTRDKPKQ